MHGALDALMLNDRGHPVIRLPAKIVENVVKMVHGQEHRDRMASVFEEMAKLEKCKTSGLVS